MAMEALKWLRQAHDLELRAGDAKTRASTFLNLCAVYSLLGRHVDALQSATHALKLLKSAIQVEPGLDRGTGMMEKVDPASMLAIAYHNIAVEQEHLERYSEAYQSYSKALDVAEVKCGPETPLTSKIRNALANAANSAQSSAPTGDKSLELIHGKVSQRKYDDSDSSLEKATSSVVNGDASGVCLDAASIVAPLVPSRQESHRASGAASDHGTHVLHQPVMPLEVADGQIARAKVSATGGKTDQPSNQTASHPTPNSQMIITGGSGPRSGEEPRDNKEPRSATEPRISLPRSVKEEANIKCWGKGPESARSESGRHPHAGDLARNHGVGRPVSAGRVQRESSSASEQSVESRDRSHSSRERARRPLSAARLPLEEDGGGSSSSNRSRQSRKTARPRTAGRERMKENDREELMALTDPSSSDAGP
jgi:hypothetical protein